MSRFRHVALGLACCTAAALACSSSKPDPPKMDRAALLDPESCKTCHPTQYADWSGSMHALASADPVFIAMNKRGQRETNGELGSFCVNCHAPMAVREGKTTDGLNLAELPPSLRGVTCFFCHSVDDVTGAHDNPLHLATDGALRGQVRDPMEGTPHGASYSELLDREAAASARMCGACHDITTKHGAAIERTFAEWTESVFSQPGGATCSQCHMEQSTSPVPIANVAGAPLRRTHGHGFAAVDVAVGDAPQKDVQRKQIADLLGASLQTALCVAQEGDRFSLRVIIDNVGGGHAFPSGATQDRRAWTEVIARQGDAELYRSGVVADGESVIAAADKDPELWLLRDCIFRPDGTEARMFWEAASIDSALLPAQVTFDPRDRRYYQSHIVQPFPRSGTLAGAPDRVTLRVRLQAIGVEVIDDLIASGDLDPAVRGQIPTHDVGAEPILEWTPSTANDTYLDDRTTVRCITKTNLSVASDKFPPAKRTRCR